jgi:obg-like ATPase 1
MPPKKKAASEESDVPLSARFGRVKNTLKMGLVGLPNVGKSSLFNLLTQQSVAAEVRRGWALGSTVVGIGASH